MELNPIFLEAIGRDASISFPMLGGALWNPPASFTVFGFTVYFYGVLFALGFLLAILYCARRAPRFGIRPDVFYDMMLWMIPVTILGARLYYVSFRLDYYVQNPAKILALRDGGLAIYGGVIAGALLLWLFCRKKKISVPAMMDLTVHGLLIGQIIGRWGNFFNREAHGGETEIFCRMGLTPPGGETVFVHPTFLYESLWNLVGLLFLIAFVKKGRRRYDGQATLFYLFWYGLGRSWIEGLRTDSLYIGATGLRVSQLLSIVLCAGALAALIVLGRRAHDPQALFVNRQKRAEEEKTEEEKEET